MLLDSIKAELVKAAKRLFRAGLVLPGEGNLSIRHPGGQAMIITPTENKYDDLEVDDLVVMDFDGHINKELSGRRKPSSEYRLHAGILLNRPRAGAVIHAHPPETVAHAVLGTHIPLIAEEMAILLGGEIPCAPYKRTGTENLVTTVLESIAKGNAVMLANHGLLACGHSITHTLETIFLVEKLAGIHRRAKNLGGSIQEIPQEDLRQLMTIFRERFSTV